MKKINLLVVVLFFLLVTIPFSQAIFFEEDTTFKKGTTYWTIKEGVNVSTFNFINNGVILDDHTFVFRPIGGLLNVTLYDLDDNQIMLSSSVEQEIDYKIIVNQKNNVLVNNKEVFLDTILVTTQPTIYKYDLFETNQENVNIKTYENKGFFESNFLVFVVDFGDSDKIIRFKNYQFILLVVTILFTIYFFRKKIQGKK